MSPDLYFLLMSTILCFVQMLIAATGANTQVGLPALAGNREGLPDIVGWPGRARRAHLNMIENLVLFAALVLIAAVAGKANATTAMGAMTDTNCFNTCKAAGLSVGCQAGPAQNSCQYNDNSKNDQL